MDKNLTELHFGADNSRTLNYFNPHKTFLTGDEHFSFDGKPLQYSVRDYWSWSFSDMYNNIYRGILAEYIVATALCITPPLGNFARVVWNPFDLLSKSGKRIEVKSSAYLQSWDGDFSKIVFDIKPARIFDHTVPTNEQTSQRNCDVYVFCLYKAETRDVSPLNLDYWEFFILPTKVLNDTKPNQKTITISSLKKLNPVHVMYDQLCSAIESCC